MSPFTKKYDRSLGVSKRAPKQDSRSNDRRSFNDRPARKGAVLDSMYATVSDLKQMKRMGIRTPGIPGDSGDNRRGSDRQHSGGSRFRSPRTGGHDDARGGSYAPRGPRGSVGSSSRFGGGRGRAPKKKFGGENIDVSRFINKAVVTETVERFVPEHQFNDFHIDERIKKHLEQRGYTTPTPIQDKAIPQVLAGNDVVGIANTGTGKTGAFLIPLLHKVLTNKESRVLVVAPTRELAQQIEAELRLITKTIPVYAAVCVGGAYIGVQLKALRYKNEFIIGTPGRLADLVERKAIDLSKFDTLVLDEADRMLDMGFINDMKQLMSGMPKEHQTLLFSATMSREIEGIIHTFLTEPTHISVKTRDTAKSVDQDVVRVPQGKHKIDILDEMLKQEEFGKVLVFARTKSATERVMEELKRRGHSVESIHGDKSQYMRQRALKQFKEGKVRALIATDVAARGLDISDVSHVINFDIPQTYDDYVHRIGRTGRGGKTGKALTFVD